MSAIAVCVVGDEAPTALDRRPRRAPRGTSDLEPGTDSPPWPTEMPCLIRSFPKPRFRRRRLFGQRGSCAAWFAAVLAALAELDEALRIRREEELPIFERLDDVRATEVAATYSVNAPVNSADQPRPRPEPV